MSKRVFLILLFALCVGLFVFLNQKGNERQMAEEKTPEETSAATKIRQSMEWDRVIREVTGRESLESLRGRLLEMTATEAVAEIERFLASGEDAATGIEFEIGSGGAMKGWPTLRVFLLDLLLEIDPAAAARIGREILAASTTADEWAISLRNVARGEEEGGNVDFLRTKTEELISNPAWREMPSVGFLNAFDVLVHTRATQSSPLLSGLIKDKDRRDLAHAAFLTFDRLVQRETIAMLEKLSADRKLQESRPEMTAQQFARADLRDERQRGLVREWLLDPARTSTELRNFAGVFPNNNQMISHNLLTTESPVSGDTLRDHDRAVLDIVRAWKADPAFQPVAEHLGAMEARLTEFVKGTE